MSADPLRNGLSLPDAAVLAPVAGAPVTVAVILFERPDLAP